MEQEIVSRHAGLTPERRRRKALDASASVIQALELLESARASSVRTKPLPLFYAAEAIAKSVSIVADAALDGATFRAHGLHGIKERRYFIRTLACRVGAPGRNVWSHLCAQGNRDIYLLPNTTDGVSQVSDRTETFQARPLAPRAEITLGELLRQLPELAEDVAAAGLKHPYIVHMMELDVTMTTNPVSVRINFILRHAHDQPTRQMILGHEKGRGGLHPFQRTQDLLDVLEYRAGPVPKLRAPEVRIDLFGRLYMNFVRTRSYLAELPIYYAALFILSDAVRYQGQWQKLLEDHPEEAVLVERFLDIAARKLPNLALNHLTDRVHLFTAPGRMT